MFSKLPILSTAELRSDGARARASGNAFASHSSFLLGNTAHFFAIHLGTSFAERRRQARCAPVTRCLTVERDAKKRIIAGDFNEWTRGLVTTMLSHHFESADILMHLRRRRTYPGVLPFMHLDHFYYDPDLSCETCISTEQAGPAASDHLPLVATFSEV